MNISKNFFCNFILFMDCDNIYAILDKKYYIMQKIGFGANSKVYTGYIIENDQEFKEKKLYAIKIGKKSDSKGFENEMEMMYKIGKNEEIVEIVTGGQGELIKLKNKSNCDDFKKSKKNTKKVSYIVLEYAKNGELFNFIKANGGFGEKIGKIIFLQILNALIYCHHSGVVHRDLKTENILVSDNFRCKLTDFGFATYSKGNKGDSLLHDYVGTESYISPEMYYNQVKGYNGICNDIFSLGIVLFIIVYGMRPFRTSLKTDNFYKLICKGDWETYWYHIEKSLVSNANKVAAESDSNEISSDFKDLFSNMVCYNPNERLKLEDIKNHPWLNGLTNSIFEKENLFSNILTEYQIEFAKRKNIIQKQTQTKG